MYLLHRKKIDIYTNVSLFLSYSEVTAVTRSSPYPDQMVDQHLETTSTALNVSVLGPGNLDEPQRQIPSEDPVTKTAIGKRPLEPVEPLQSDFAAVGIELLVRLARGELAPRLSLVSPKVFFSILSPMEFWFLAAVASGLLSWGHFISSYIIDLIKQRLLELN